MGESPRTKAAETTTKTTTQGVLLLATTALDTTWRTLIPGIVGTVLGIMLDHAVHTVPIFTIIGLVLGITLSGFLIYQQFKGLKK
jgi:F0F1-type ATP synthase assembly protein I